MASAVPIEAKRLDKIARLVETIRPECWSEHLAFVRGGGYEIGHLAAPPRTAATIEGTAKNLASARQIVGALPAVENIASLIDPPGSRYDEPAWISEILALSGTELLLDLHNVYTNAINFGFDPFDFLASIPWNRVTTIHIAGGEWIAGDSSPATHRMLDDHLHDVPLPVYDLLREAGSSCPSCSDGDLGTRWVVSSHPRAAGPIASSTKRAGRGARPAAPPRSRMSSALFEAFLAKIYVDANARAEFLSDPSGEARRAGLSPEEADALQNIDWLGLKLASRSFEKKRLRHKKSKFSFTRLFGRK